MSARRRGAEAAAVIIALALLWAMSKTTPNYPRLVAPIETHGAAGEELRGRSIAARVDGVDVARGVQRAQDRDARTFTSSGLFVIVHATANATTQPARVAMAALVAADGTRYLQTRRLDVVPGLLGNVDLQPGVPAQGDLVFEVPADALADAHVLLSAAPFGLAPLDSVLNVDLGIDRARAAALIASMSAVYRMRER